VRENVLEGDALVRRLQHAIDKVLCLLADGLELRDCINETLLSKEYFMVLTDLRISLSFSPSKGGAAESKM
jgi:hypothetical protein